MKQLSIVHLGVVFSPQSNRVLGRLDSPPSPVLRSLRVRLSFPHFMTPLLKKLVGLNWLLVANMLALAIFGVVAIYSATYMREDSISSEFWRKQATWVAIGFLAFMVTSLIDYRWIRWGALPMYLAGLVFLVLTKFIGSKVYGARSWLHIGPINFQPAQLAVIAGIMVLALFLSHSQFRDMHPMLRLLLCGIIVGAPCLLILLQPDL